MPQPTPEELWKLVADTGLVDHDQVEALRREFGRESLPPGTTGEAVTEAVAKWLVRRQVLTIWQARQLARGSRGPFFLGDYRFLERLDDAHLRTSGAKASLVRARHEPSGRGVCLLLLDPNACKQLEVWTDIVRRTRVAHEARDPLTSRTWALEQSGAQRFIVCEDIVGQSLADELAARGPLPIAEAGPLMVAVAGAVAELHRLGTVHGGISLDSLRREPAAAGTAHTGRVRLLQFPLVADPHVVPPRPPLDAPETIRSLGMRACFIAPELLLPGARSDARSDVYALGCLFHALLTGTPPCWKGDAQESLAQAAFVGPAPLGPPRVPMEVATLVSYMVARDPAARYATAAEVADAIALCLGMPAVSPGLPAQRPPIDAAAPEPRPEPPAMAAAPQSAGVSQMGAPSLVGAPSLAQAPSLPTVESRTAARGQRRPRWLVPAIALGVAAMLAAVAVPFLWPAEKPSSPDGVKRPPVKVAAKPPGKPSPASVDREPADTVTDTEAKPQPASAAVVKAAPAGTKVVDSETLPWESPTSGAPPTLAYLPAGSQLMLLARPAEMLAQGEGTLFLRALGPRVAAALDAAAGWCGCEADEIETIQAGWQAGGPDEVIGGYAIRGRGVLPVADDPARRSGWGPTKEREEDGETIHDGASLSFWMPSREEGRVLVVAPKDLLATIIEAAAERRQDRAADDGADGWRDRLEAALPPDLEDLVGMLDDRRHLTLFGSPNYLLHDGRAVFAGPLARLVDPLAAFFGDDVRAAGLSVHFGGHSYLELDCLVPPGTPAAKLAATLAGRIESLGDTVEEYCNALDPHPYGRKLVMRLPRMLGVVAGNLRAGGEGRGAVVNCHLPEHAAHNLALAAELAIEQTPRAGGSAPAAVAAAPQSARDRLQKKISLVFVRDTLEKSVQMLSEEIGLPIEILGKDLELEGITKNQSFGLDERDQTADAVLRKILANSNQDGKLVYVIRSKAGAESVEVTTRAAAAKRGDTLPPGFEQAAAAEPPDGKPEKKRNE